MGAFGSFSQRKNMAPTVVGSLIHPDIQKKIPLEFIVNTGADYTLITPVHQALLGIRDNQLLQVPEPFETLAGPLHVDALPECTLLIGDSDGNVLGIKSLTVYFLSKKSKKKLAKRGGSFLNILGRDAMQHLALGYCQSYGRLFLTPRTADYSHSLEKHFPPSVCGDANWPNATSSVAKLNKNLESTHEHVQAALKRLDSLGEV